MDGNKLPPKCPFTTGSFQWRKLFLMFLSGLGMGFFNDFSFFSFLDLLSQLLFMEIFWSFSNGVFLIFALLQVALCSWCITFLGCQKQCWLTSLSDLGKLSVLYPVLLVSQAGAEVLTPVSLGSFFYCSVLGFGCFCSAWQWWLYSEVPDGSTSC